jgi:hypothetical protein
VSGFIAENFEEFVKYSLLLMEDAEKLAEMKRQSRASARSSSWDAVFEAVYDAYREALEIAERQKAERAVAEAA